MHRDVIELMLQIEASLDKEQTIVDQTKDERKSKMYTHRKKVNVHYLFYTLKAIIDNTDREKMYKNVLCCMK